jgi:hypothetical protein
MQLTSQDKKAAREGFAYVVIRGGKRVCYASTLGEAKRECGSKGKVVSISGMRYTAQNPHGSLNVRNPSLNVRNPSAPESGGSVKKTTNAYGQSGWLVYDHKGNRVGYYASKKVALEMLAYANSKRSNPSLNVRNPSLNVRNPKAKGWQVTPRANTAGTHMLAGDYNNLDEAGDAWEICYAIFPPARQNRDMRYKGYGPEWIFTAPNGQVFTVYDRSDVPRIGGVQGQYTFNDLLAWLKTQKKRNPSINVRNPSAVAAPSRLWEKSKSKVPHFTSVTEDGELTYHLTSKDGVTWEAIIEPYRGKQWSLEKGSFAKVAKAAEKDLRAYNKSVVGSAISFENPSLNVRNPSGAKQPLPAILQRAKGMGWTKARGHYQNVSEDGEFKLHLSPDKRAGKWDVYVDEHRGSGFYLEEGLTFEAAAKRANQYMAKHGTSGSAIRFVENPSLNVRNPSLNVR